MKRHATTGIIMISLIAVIAVGCATGSRSEKIGSGDIVADRQRLMKLNGASWADAQAKMKAGNIEGIAVNAETMALNSEHIPMLFPEGSLTDKSKAKPEIWQKRPEFDSAAKNMGQWAVKLRDTAGVRHLPHAVPRSAAAAADATPVVARARRGPSRPPPRLVATER